MVGTWAASLAGLRQRVATNDQGVAIALIACGLAAIVTMQIGGRYADRYGAMLPCQVGGAVMVVASGVLGWAPSYPVLLGAAIVLGAGNGALDVAMNSLGVQAETERSRPVMSRLHACFSIGSLGGAGLVLLTSPLAGDPWPALALAAVVGTVVLVLIARWHVSSPPRRVSEEAGSGRRGLPPIAWALGLMALCFGLSEGTAMDWSAIHVTDVTGVSPGVGAAGLAAVSASMVAIRLAGDAIVARVGRARVVQVGALAAAGGYAGIVFVQPLWLVLLCWLVVGFGVGLVAPQIYAVAGHLGGGRVLAVVTGFGYTAFLAGPALIGFASHEFGIQRAMVIPLVTALALSALAFTRLLHR
ncbi:MFS transporter [Epidermidibacterium keratini]|uniref:MFS transporter n=2 Tax=Epidermidibacterium keratini TaxID=1891644 RepID=A0A7L4YSX6_9ACTN|nr:MFS transporter [Epidermidibacterium keratini]